MKKIKKPAAKTPPQMTKKTPNKEQGRATPEVAFSTPDGISATVWKNQANGKSGPFVYRSIQLQKRYRDKGGTWHSSATFFKDEIPVARAILQRVYMYLLFEAPRERKTGAGGQNDNP